MGWGGVKGLVETGGDAKETGNGPSTRRFGWENAAKWDKLIGVCALPHY